VGSGATTEFNVDYTKEKGDYLDEGWWIKRTSAGLDERRWGTLRRGRVWLVISHVLVHEH